jgi:hypothetical protein
MATNRKTKTGNRGLEAKLELLSTHFSDFAFLTKLSDEDFARIETAGGVKLDADHRAAIELHLREFEFFRRLEAKAYGEIFRSILKRFETGLDENILIAKTLNRLPGHLWSYVADGAVDSEVDLQRIEANRNRLTQLNALVDKARARRAADPFLPRLLVNLEREFIAVGGRVTGISRKASDKRGGQFLQFAEAAISTLPHDYRPKKPVGARWERILLKRRKGNPSQPRERIWIGRPHPFLAKT